MDLVVQHLVSESAETSNASGEVTRLNGNTGIEVTVTAKGYMTEYKTLSSPAVQEIQPAALFEKVERRPVTVVMELYADPGPTVELILPNGFRGDVRAELQAKETPRDPQASAVSATRCCRPAPSSSAGPRCCSALPTRTFVQNTPMGPSWNAASAARRLAFGSWRTKGITFTSWSARADYVAAGHGSEHGGASSSSQSSSNGSSGGRRGGRRGGS